MTDAVLVFKARRARLMRGVGIGWAVVGGVLVVLIALDGGPWWRNAIFLRVVVSSALSMWVQGRIGTTVRAGQVVVSHGLRDRVFRAADVADVEPGTQWRPP